MSANSSASASPLGGGSLEDSLLDNSHYEQACDQAIAMCDGNLRSTIKALIMANEYLEAELMELQAAISSGCMPKTSENKASENKTSENKASESKTSESRTSESKTTENRRSENRTSENKASENETLQNKAPENPASNAA